jgi:predicted N-acetyltransferase YhbS
MLLMFTTHTFTAAEVADAHWLAIAKLYAATWENDATDDFPAKAEHIKQTALDTPAMQYVLTLEGDALVAAGSSFAREIIAGDVRHTALAMAGVAVAEPLRGRGLGKQVVRELLGRVDDGTYPFAIFQTDVPRFYEKLNCRVLANRIVNSLADDPQARPFWSSHAICYPAAFPLGKDTIDLLGPGY